MSKNKAKKRNEIDSTGKNRKGQFEKARENKAFLV